MQQMYAKAIVAVHPDKQCSFYNFNI